MTIWTPHLEGRKGPLYLAVADALAEDVGSGALGSGTRLPTHRDLANRLGVTVGTVSRAYGEARRRGLVTGEVGRGTFVRGRSGSGEALRLTVIGEDQPVPYDFGLNLPATGDGDQWLARTLATLGAEGGLSSLMDYQPDVGIRRHRETAARWISRTGLTAPAKRVAVCNGAQHGMSITLMALTRPGDVVLTEELTYPGLRELAGFLQLRLVGVAMDGDGLRPDAFEEACRDNQAKTLYCMPTLQNPIATIMSENRRQEVVDIARRHDITIIEDDVYGFLPADRPPPLAAMAPEISYFITSLSKSLAPGLRVGYVVAPDGMARRLGAVTRSLCRMATPLAAEIASRWIEDGSADHMARWQRKEARTRQQIARRALTGVSCITHPDSFHMWIPLPEPWRAGEFTSHLQNRGVVVIPADAFMVGRNKPLHAVRVCLGPISSHQRLEKGLSIIAESLNQSPRPNISVI